MAGERERERSRSNVKTDDNNFVQWMLANIEDIEDDVAEYEGIPVSLDSEIVRYSTCLSFVVITSRQTSAWLLKDSAAEKRTFWTSTLLTLFVGWWGFPFGIIFTPIYLIQNLSRSDKKTIGGLLDEAQQKAEAQAAAKRKKAEQQAAKEAAKEAKRRDRR